MKSLHKNIFNLSALISVFIFPSLLHATDYSDLNAYEIEIVIFSFNQTQSAGSEIWPDLVKTETVEDTIQLHNATSLTQEPGPDEKAYYYSKIPAENFRLSKQVEKLTASNRFKVIYHSAWIQPGLDKENAEFIHIQSIENDTSTLPVIDAFGNIYNNNAANGYNSLIIQPGDNTAVKAPLLDGVVKVELGRYLHIYFDLKYQRNLAPEQGVIDSSKNYKDIKFYPVQTHRRMRSKEIHYIDHPLIGILVLATPFELPVEEGEEMINQPLYKLENIPISN